MSTRDQLVARPVRAGELEVLGADQAEIDACFATVEFRFHGPGGFESDYAGLTEYFRSVRAPSTIGRSGAGSWWLKGCTLHARRGSRDLRPGVHAVTSRPAAAEWQRIFWDLINLFRFDDQGRLVEEWVRTDQRSFLRQLGAVGR